MDIGLAGSKMDLWSETLYTTCMAGRYGSDIVALDYFDSETNFMAGYISES